ncbi:hypothetical protein T09_9450 [Trichinella sp. T9]|nr:hypothetical protein T09_9450 [Trichinella sp. T9]KRX56152.1 hypothetical protein T09_9450 [Trichinella sp. T9]
MIQKSQKRMTYIKLYNIYLYEYSEKGFPKWIRSDKKRQLAAEKQWIAWCGRFRMITGISKVQLYSFIWKIAVTNVSNLCKIIFQSCNEKLSRLL